MKHFFIGLANRAINKIGPTDNVMCVGYGAKGLDFDLVALLIRRILMYINLTSPLKISYDMSLHFNFDFMQLINDSEWISATLPQKAPLMPARYLKRGVGLRFLSKRIRVTLLHKRYALFPLIDN